MMEHSVRFEQGHDCVRFKCRWGEKSCVPHAGGSHGVGSLTIRFVTKGDKGAVQFVLSTGWTPRRLVKNAIGYLDPGHGWGPSGRDGALPTDLGYHSKAPLYEGQEMIAESCEWCDGGPCYYDGSGLNANNAMYTLVNGGDEALWKYLDAVYEATFNGQDYPKVTEYPFPLRKGES